MPSKKPLLAPCVSDKEDSTALANNVPVEPQSAKTEDVKIQPGELDEFDDDDAIEALVAAEAAENSSNPV